MPKRILLQLDPDSHPSCFDSVVAVDAGVDHLLRYGDVQVISVTPLVHGAMFTRGGDELRNTAIFIGGSDVSAAEELYEAAQAAFFGPIRVSLMLDANGCNTTAAAAVVAASRHVQLAGASAVVLGATGPVGRRVAQLLMSDHANVKITSRSHDRAQSVCDSILANCPEGRATAAVTGTPDQTARAISDAQIVIACGAAGVELVDEEQLRNCESLAVVIDLNAVPPPGIGGVGVTDKAKQMGGAVAYGAIGVGGLKMKTHRRAIESLFESNDKTLDAKEIYEIAKGIG